MIRNRHVTEQRNTVPVPNTTRIINRHQPIHEPRPVIIREREPDPDLRVLIQPGYATGDMFGIAAALIDDEELHVVISKGNGTFIDHTDKADSIQKFYKDSGIDEKRIHVINVKKLRGAVTKEKLKQRAAKFRRGRRIGGVNYGTDYIARKYSENLKNKLKDRWDINHREDDAIKRWLEQQGIPTSGDRLLILWSRFSGKGGDIHIEHDTSYTGIKQIVYRVAEMYDTIIITGDKGYIKERGSKFDDIAREVNTDVQSSRVFNITEFWDGEPEFLSWMGTTRFGQFKLYDYFERHFNEVKHLGFRSGNLEVMAMLGYKVRYLEEVGSESGARMFAWRAVEGGKTEKKGDATGYERLQLAEPPTRSGKYLQKKIREINTEAAEEKAKINDEKEKEEIEKEAGRRKSKYTGAYFAPRKKDGTIPIPISKDEKSRFSEGFNDGDMNIILGFLRPERWIDRQVTYNPVIPQKRKVYEKLLESSGNI
ncbi:hypothetical protein [Chryseobacterium sp. ON_d1]|uniref:hypothetical protein n=1 Tax=Chryseobacterium sp. ON_d1 TaxID=2583211 RepID=UPI001157F821|nr:hypothetical protein [Chryseobacterium sp. ON_d1]